MDYQDVVALLTPFIAIPIGWLWKTVNKNRDEVSSVKVDVVRLESKQAGVERSLERFIDNIERSIENQQEVTKEIHTLVTTLDKRMAVFETIVKNNTKGE